MSDIAHYLQEFEAYLKYEKRVSPNTLTAYKSDLDQFVGYLAGTYELTEVNKVDRVHLRSYLVHLNQLKYKESVLHRKISAIKSWMKFLLKRGVLEKNPSIAIKAPKIPSRLPQYLEMAQSEALFLNAEFPEGLEGLTHQLILELLYQTGMRRAELINLKDKDVDLHRRQLVVLGKRAKERVLPMGEKMLVLIQNYREEKRNLNQTFHDNLLTLSSGKPIYENYVYRVVKRYLNLEVSTMSKRSPHVLRHTFATQISNNGAPIGAVKDLLGHSSLAATQVYTHSNIEHLKKIHQIAHPKSMSEE